MGVDDAELDSLPLQVVLELGRFEMVVSELRQLAPGVVLPLTRNVDGGVDIVVNGKRIGAGTLVRLGDGLCVRVSRLTQDG
jgi:type III secretion protein Q